MNRFNTEGRDSLEREGPRPLREFNVYSSLSPLNFCHGFKCFVLVPC